LLAPTEQLVCLVVSFSDQAEARRQKNRAAKQRRDERLEQKRKEMIQQIAKEEEAAK